MANQSINKILQIALKNLTDRQKEVVLARFGLGASREPKTLEAIGKGYGVTRERVRQIEAVGLTMIKADLAAQKPFQTLLANTKKLIKNVGGVISEEMLVKALNTELKDFTKNHVALLASATGSFLFFPEDKSYRSFYYLDKESLKQMLQFTDQWMGTLHNEREAVLAGSYTSLFKSFVKAKNVPESQAENFLTISKRIHKSPYGTVGLAEWAEIKPRTIRDRIYLVLKKQGAPLHFVDIAKVINEAKFDTHVALASTVHNELIKDNRFVLVGRGLYGLKEHGFEPGTAKEVIHRILKKHGPMTSKALIDAVQKERFFKYNTILVNLQNREIFERTKEGVYKVREA